MDLTQLLGLTAFLATALVCARAGARSSAAPWLWRGLALLYLLLTVDMAFDLRFALRSELIEAAVRAGDYGDRRAVQPLAIAAFVALALAGAWALARGLRSAGGPERLAVLGAAGTLIVVGVEVISLHAVDAALYRPVGPVLAIALLWVGSAALVAVSALVAARR